MQAPGSIDARFVGRARELDQVARGLDEALGGRGRLFLLVGEPGIGKTALCDTAATAAAARGLPVLWGRAWEAGGAPAYWPWLDVLAELARRLDDTTLNAALDAEGAPLLAELVPEIRPRLPPAPAFSPPPPDEARFRLCRAVTSLVRRAAAPQGLVVVFDDLHSADRASLLLLYALARELRSLRLLLLATCRDVEARLDAETSDLIFSRVAREGITLTLPRLDRAAAADLLRGRHASALPADLETRIFDSTHGNPLFLVEMLRLYDEEGPASIAAGVVPAGVRDVLRQRLARVADDTRSLLDLAAVAGDEVDPALLAAASGREVGWVAARAADATRAGIFGQRAGRPWFSHALVREVLYRELGDDQRRALHAAVGAALERAAATSGAAPPLMELAHHALAAGSELPRAVDLTVRAAARAVAVAATDQAIVILERAAGVLDAAAAPPALRARVLLALAEARIRAGDSVQGTALACEVATLAERAGDPALLARAALTYGLVLKFAMVDPVMVDLLESALAALPPGDSPLRARLLARLAAALQPAVDIDEPVRLAREAVATARRLGDRRGLLETMFDGLSAMMDVVEPRERRALNLEVEALAIAEGDRDRLLRTHARLALDHLALGELSLADARIDAFEALAGELRASWLGWRVPLFRAARASIDGRFADAEAIEARARQEALRVGDPLGERALVLLREGILRMADRHDEMRAHDAVARRQRAGLHLAPAWQSLAAALLYARVEDEAQARFHLGLVPAELRPPHHNMFPICCLAEPAAFVGPPELARDLYGVLEPLADQYVMLGMSQMQWEGPIGRLLALLAARLGRPDEAVARFDDALERLERLGARPLLARTRYELGRTLLARAAAGDRPRARALLAGARAIAVELDMPGLVRLIDARLPATSEAETATTTDTAAASAPAPAPAVEARAALSLALEGEFWTVTSPGGKTFRLKDSLGLQYLARLFAEPGREIHVLELVRGAGGADEAAVDGGDAGELLDDEARAEYGRRLEDLRESLAEAESFGDTARAGRAREEIDFLAAELGRAVGLGGRARRAGSAAERARSAVQRRIKNALARLGEAAPELTPFLAKAIRTGNYCVYRPPGA
ncbi:MAG TPA: AAA family ATPase [Polyangia bacterium]|nr:AAA family ATPase [Polyangia bacterium]